jgi:hypothetical protein
MAVAAGQPEFVLINLVLLMVNSGIFIWQAKMRADARGFSR